MPYLQERRTVALRCDARRCETRLDVPVHLRTVPVYSPRFTRWMASARWTAWVSRGQRIYCPEHRPSSPNMRQVV